MSDLSPHLSLTSKSDLFDQLVEINRKPEPFEVYSAKELWTDQHTSLRMLDFHLNDALDLSSRNSQFIDRSVNWIAAYFGVNEGTKIVDFGCGPGLYANRLAQRGASVTGIDFSERSIGYAQAEAERKGLDVRYIQQDYLESKLDDQFDLILMIFCDFCALSPDQRRDLLQEFRRILSPDGHLLFDVYSDTAFEARTETTTYEVNLLDRFWSENPYYGFLNTFKYLDLQIVLDKYTIVESGRIRTIFNWLQFFTPRTLQQELSNSGLRIAERFANVAGQPYAATTEEFAVVVVPE